MVEHAEFWDSPATQRNDRPRPLESARCSLCGIELPKGLMMPDGGGACADVRWYCKDTKSCTERWTAHLARGPGQGAQRKRAPAESVQAQTEESQPAGADP
jgi:hypothetical protein